MSVFKMMPQNRVCSQRVLILVVAIVMSLHTIQMDGYAAVVDLSTPGNSANWLVTGTGAGGAPSFETSVNRAGDISISDNSLVTGNFVAGASSAQYNGFWYVENSFALPAGATDVELRFDGLWANDRVVMFLNGNEVGNATFGGGTGLGLMRFAENDPDVPYTFSETNSGIITDHFVIGGNNVLRMTVNNTGINLAAPTVAAAFPLDGTAVHLPLATLSFTAVPEPNTFAFLTAVMASAMAARRRKR